MAKNLYCSQSEIQLSCAVICNYEIRKSKAMANGNNVN